MDALDITALAALLTTVGLVAVLIWFLGGRTSRPGQKKEHRRRSGPDRADLWGVDSRPSGWLPRLRPFSR